MNCKPTRPENADDPNRWTCSVCGFTDVDTAGHFPDRIHRTCSGVPDVPKLPPLRKRLANFTKAAIEHAKAGSPTCTQEQIDARYAICVSCHLYIPDADNPEIGHCAHADCGCGISKVAGYVKKLAWADQSCPIGKWLSLVPASSLANGNAQGIIRS